MVVRGYLPLPKNPTPTIGPTGLMLRTFGPTLLTVENIIVQICLYCVKCKKFDQLILRRITEIVATRSQILRLKWTKFLFGYAGGLSAPQTF